MDKGLVIFGNIWLVGSIVSEVMMKSLTMLVFGVIVTTIGLFVKGEKDE